MPVDMWTIGFADRLRLRPIRTSSGVAPVAVLTGPYPCPGECIFCPEAKGFPKSYLPLEPGAQRAALANFDPFKQTAMRLQTLAANGHATDKIELLILGATWSAYPHKYQEWFIQRCLDAMNGTDSASLAEAQKTNATDRPLKYQSAIKIFRWRAVVIKPSHFSAR
jgi:elongator complex protein 3